MSNMCQKFKASRECLLDMQPAQLESFFRKIVPDEQFRFITFQANDYRKQTLTFLLFNYVPETVFVTVENAADLESAIDELIVLNPGVEWNCKGIQYFDRDDTAGNRITVELLLDYIPMRVNKEGILIHKLKVPG